MMLDILLDLAFNRRLDHFKSPSLGRTIPPHESHQGQDPPVEKEHAQRDPTRDAELFVNDLHARSFRGERLMPAALALKRLDAAAAPRASRSAGRKTPSPAPARGSVHCCTTA